MDDPAHGHHPDMGTVQLPHIATPYQASHMMGTTAPFSASQLTASPVSQMQFGQHQLAYQHIHQQQLHQLEQHLHRFWENQYKEVMGTKDFKNHSLPLARIKKIMKADEDVRMIAAEAPVLFARACEMFILELTHRSWAYTEENKRRTLQKNDIAGAITRTENFDFLVDIVPKEEQKDEMIASIPSGGDPSDSLSYYYMPQQVGPLGMIMTKPDEVDQALLYAQQPQPYVPQQLWDQQQQSVVGSIREESSSGRYFEQ